jgi:hypothetical protein
MLLPCCVLVVFGLAVGVLAMVPQFAPGPVGSLTGDHDHAVA